MIYKYNKTVNSTKLSEEIKVSTAKDNFLGVVSIDGNSSIHYSVDLTEPQKQVLDGVVNAHSPVDTSLLTRISIKDRKEFGDELMEEFKLRNIQEGIQWYQAIHLHARIRAWQVTLPESLGSAVETIDIMNMILSGDIETTALSLQYGVDDDMTSPLHWITSARRMWLINKMRTWLGWPTI